MARLYLKLLAAGAALAAATWIPSPAAAEGVIRAGIIGCDTSHAVAFAELLNAPDATGPRAQVEVVAAYPGGSDDIPSSRDRVAGYVEKLRSMNVEIVDSIDALLTKVDVVLLESVDGRRHLEQARPVFAAGKRTFIDKPLAADLKDAVEIARLARQHNVPWFSASALRYSNPTIELAANKSLGGVQGVDAFSPCSLEPHHRDLAWYGVHGVETLFTLMGPGCESVTRTHSDAGDVATGRWRDGRIGTFRGMRAGKQDYGATVFGEQGIATATGFGGYGPLVDEIAQFFISGKPPIDPAITLEMFAFIEAADESKRRGGAAVSLAEVLQAAGAEPTGAKQRSE
jgi:predicted dehydrogenase